jgi:hypothetical protein
MLLAVALVALNSFFWLAQSGLARSPGDVLSSLFGSRLIRAEVLVQTPTGPADYRIDRGVLVSFGNGEITLREQNGELVTIPVAGNVRVQGGGGNLGQLRKKLRVVTVIRDANGPVEQIQVEGGSSR